MCLGIPGQIVRIDDAAKNLATVDVSGVKRQVNVTCIVSGAHPIGGVRIVDMLVGEQLPRIC